MKATGAVVLVAGVTLMSAPLVAQQLGVDVTRLFGAAPEAQGTPPGTDGIAGLVALVNDGIGSVGPFLGGAAQDGPSQAPDPAAVAAEMEAACAALSGANGPTDCTASGGDKFFKAFGAATQMSITGEMPDEASTRIAASAGAVRGHTGNDEAAPPRRAIGAKFIKVTD
jgi:hypothetical protein